MFLPAAVHEHVRPNIQLESKLCKKIGRNNLFYSKQAPSARFIPKTVKKSLFGRNLVDGLAFG